MSNAKRVNTCIRRDTARYKTNKTRTRGVLVLQPRARELCVVLYTALNSFTVVALRNGRALSLAGTTTSSLLREVEVVAASVLVAVVEVVVVASTALASRY